MNSFRFLERGVKAEIDRQIELLEAGEPVVQETLHFDPATERLTPLRSKEEAHDYRYFPEPDLRPAAGHRGDDRGRARRVPRAAARHAPPRFEQELGLNPDARGISPSARELADYFERALAAAGANGEAGDRSSSPTGSRSWSSGSAPTPIPRAVKCHAGSAGHAGGDGRRPRRSAATPAREVLTLLVAEGGDPRAIVEREGLGAISGRRTTVWPRSSTARSPPTPTRPRRCAAAT